MELILAIVAVMATSVVLTEFIDSLFSTIKACNKNKYEYLKSKEANAVETEEKEKV